MKFPTRARRGLSLSLFLLIAACAPRSAPTTAPDAGGESPATTAPADTVAAPGDESATGSSVGEPVDGVACVGRIEPPPPGVAPASDPAIAEALLAKALGPTDKGSLCVGQVFEVREAVTVYRVWNSEKAYTERGTWWSFAPPTGTRDDYREANAVCEEWSRLDRLVVCEITVGAHIVVGPGQSATCESGPSFPKSATNQVFIPNDGRADEFYVDNCKPSVPWP